MNEEPKDPILESCLEEVLGGQTPPDLTARILQSLETAPDSNTPPLVQPVEKSSRRGGRRRTSRDRKWLGQVVAVCLLIGAGMFIGRLWLNSEPEVAVNPLPDAPIVNPSTTPDPTLGPSVELPAENRLADSLPVSEFPQDDPQEAEQALPPLELRESELFTANVEQLQMDVEVASRIDQHVVAGWELAAIEPAKEISDEELAARLYEVVLGRSASEEEQASLTETLAAGSESPALSRAAAIRGWWSQGNIQHDFARHWSNLLANEFLGAGPPRQSKYRRGLQSFLQRALRQDLPLDQIASQILVAEGDGGPGGDTAAASFLLASLKDDAAHATGEVGRVFLGERMICSRCHDDPGNPQLTQQRFWELNAFLRQTAVIGTATPQLISQDIADAEGVPAGAIQFQRRDGTKSFAYPNLGNGQFPQTGKLSEFDRRAALADQVVQEAGFRRVMVNRVWKGIFQYGFTTPVDELGANSRVSHPELLEDLSSQFAEQGFRLQRLVSWIVLSKPFRLAESDRSPDLLDTPEQGGNPTFARFYRPVARQDGFRDLLSARLKSVEESQKVLGQRAATPANLIPMLSSGQGIIEKMAPGEEVVGLDPWQESFFHVGPRDSVKEILAAGMSTNEKVSHLFWAVLQRDPTEQESLLVQRILQAHDSETRGLNDVWWALIRSREFKLSR